MIVLDVSHYQQDLNLDKIPHDGIIARAVTRDLSIDKAFYQYMKRPEPKGCYKYTYAHNRNDAGIEAVALAQACRGLDLPLGIWLDIESDYHRSCGDALIDDIIQEYNRVLMNYGMILSGVYCDWDFYQSHKGVLKKYPIWCAKWGVKKPDLNCVGWQFTNKYRDHDLDASYWYGYQLPEEDGYIKYTPENVRKLQKYLNDNYQYSLDTDGIMGKKTFTAICQSLAL